MTARFVTGRWRCSLVAALAGLAACVAALPGAARGQVSATQPIERRALVAATEDRLWLARIRDGTSELTYRGTSGDFVPPTPFNATIVSLTAVGTDAYAFQTDGSFYRFAPTDVPGAEPWNREFILPGQALALHMADVAGVPYALVPSAVAAQLPPAEQTDGGAQTRPFEPGRAPLSLVRYGGRGWLAVAPCPAVVPADAPAGRGPRLCYAGGRLYLFWTATDTQISYMTFAPEARRWQAGGTLGIPGLKSFWVAVVNRLPTVVADVTGRTGARELLVYRLMGGDGPAAGGGWRQLDIELSALPPTATPAQPLAAFGFNQHLGLLVAGADGSAYIRFGRFAGPPALATVDVFATPAPRLPPGLFPMLRMALTLFVLVALFAFRRGAIATPIELPRGLAVALTLQRLAGCAVDLLPFSLLASLVLRVGWSEAVRGMAAWAFDPQINTTGLPETPMLLWWAFTVGSYTLYAGVMETLTGRTLGKMLLGVRVCAQTGGPARVWQIILRNAFRLIEFLPPCWILGFVVLLSRNRQRVGDIFAYTLAVRAVSPKPKEPSGGERG